MRIKTLVSAIAIALAATVGSAYAAEQFATLDGVTAQPLASAELDRVKGAAAGIHLTLPVSDPNEPAPGELDIEALVFANTLLIPGQIFAPQN